MAEPEVSRVAPATVLVTGGAGYIGSHAVLALKAAGHRPVVLDDLSNGERRLVPADVPLVEGDVGDPALLARVMAGHGIEAVMHFAGSIVVPESVADPLKYYANNSAASLTLVRAALDRRVRAFIFSSTAAVYGAPETVPIAETSPTRPINPYGRSKLVTEWLLGDVAAAHGLAFLALRYFNVAGADPEGRAGQCGRGATHLIKVAAQAALGLRPKLEVFGTDYPTPDGTCIRDYIHVSDLAAAHVAGLAHLLGGGEGGAYNCGYGRGFSVREVVRAVERAAGQPLAVEEAPRRAGDPPSLVADAGRLRQALGWRPRFDDLDLIVRSALDWERRISKGDTRDRRVLAG
jgi:UDP-glucose 4-epimerase